MSPESRTRVGAWVLGSQAPASPARRWLPAVGAAAMNRIGFRSQVLAWSLVACTLSGCTQGAAPLSTSPSPLTQPSSGDASGAGLSSSSGAVTSPSSRSIDLFSGSSASIITAMCSNTSDQRLTAHDLTSDATSVRSFVLPSWEKGALACGGSPSGRVLRQEFNADFTRMAVTSSGGTDTTGTKHIGYIDIRGQIVDLTPPAGAAYGSRVPEQFDPMFNPSDGRIWFETPDGFGSADPEKGFTSSRNEQVPSFHRASSGEYYPLYFSPNGTFVLPVWTSGDNVYSPDGSIRLEYRPFGFYVSKPGAPSQSGTEFSYSPGVQNCRPLQVIDSHRFLCYWPGSQVYLMTINGRHVTQKPLLPDSDKTLHDLILDPTGQRMAFVASSGSGSSLYISSSVTQEEPKLVGQIDQDEQILAWRG